MSAMTLKKKMIISLSTSATALCLVAMPYGVLAADDQEGRWEDTKRSAQEFWSDFKQDSKQNWKDTKSAFRDGWIEGKLEAALIANEHLNPFDIDIQVDNHTATLKGHVSNEVEIELAEAIAKGIEGIDSVDNKLRVKKQKKEQSRDTDENEKSRNFTRYLKDATLTADIKTDLIGASSIKGLDIDVDVYRSSVTLNGKVRSESEKELAEKIVENNEDVRKVVNNLVVSSASR